MDFRWNELDASESQRVSTPSGFDGIVRRQGGPLRHHHEHPRADVDVRRSGVDQRECARWSSELRPLVRPEYVHGGGQGHALRGSGRAEFHDRQRRLDVRWCALDGAEHPGLLLAGPVADAGLSALTLLFFYFWAARARATRLFRTFRYSTSRRVSRKTGRKGTHAPPGTVKRLRTLVRGNGEAAS